MTFRNILLAAAMTIAAASCNSPDPAEKGDSGKMNRKQLYEAVDAEIERRNLYTEEKEKRLDMLRQSASVKDQHYRLGVYDKLIEEYEAYVCDSALKYVEEARLLAKEMGNTHEETRLLIKKADIASHAGLFTQARDMLRSLRRSELPENLLPDYYAAYVVLFQYENEYLPEGDYTERSRRLHHVYIDSLMQVTTPDELGNITNRAMTQAATEPGKVIKELEQQISRYQPGSREYSILASVMSHVYALLNKPDKETEYLAKTVISDIKGAVKENMAIRELATRVFEDGDIERANKYMKVSMDDAVFYSPNTSNTQSGRMLPVIDKAYDLNQKKHQKRLRAMVYITLVLIILEAVCLVIIMRQSRRRKEATKRVSQTNEELSEMSTKLRSMNEVLEKTNAELKTSNHIAQEYAGLFMEFGSLTISNLHAYHQNLRNLALQGNVKAILKKLDSGDVTDETLRTFYQKFDEAILNLYPQFDKRVNALLTDDGQIILRKGERLNTELRILALIKIGITDSEKISEFLRCSLSTIYTYRSKLKRRALNPEEFEANLKEI